MRGSDQRSGELFSYVDLEKRVRLDHPLRAVRVLTGSALETLSGDFAALYSGLGRPSIAPEMLLRAMLVQAFYSVRSERQLMERLEFDLLFRWFVGLGMDDPVWDHSTFSKNRDRLLDGEIAAKFLSAVLAQPRVKRLLSSDHFSVDGTLIEAWASMKSFKPNEPPDAGGTGGGGRNAPNDLQIEQQFPPILRTFAPAVGEAEQLLFALRRRADDDQDALLGVFKTGLQVNAVGPHVDVALGRQIALPPMLVLVER